MSRAGFLVLLLLGAPLSAQTIVRPDPPLDSARAALRDAVLVLRDSLGAVDAAASRLQRDYRQASAAALESRAGVMTAACASSARTVAPTRRVVRAASAANELVVHRRDETVKALDQLHAALARCQSEFGSMSRRGEGEEVRDYGNHRARPVLAAIRRYERAAGGLLSAMGIRVIPRGAGPGPLGSLERAGMWIHMSTPCGRECVGPLAQAS